MKVLFIGDQPSSLMKPGALPFEGAKCEARFKEWAQFVSDGDYHVVNQSEVDIFKVRVIEAYYKDIPIVALGAKASKALKSIEHFKLPHPSGLNRKINNKEYIKAALEECKEYVSRRSNVCT